MEEELLEIEDPPSSNNYGKEIRRSKQKMLGVAILLGLSLPILLPSAHMLIFYLIWGTAAVDKLSCTCNCWDTVFKGPYEKGVAGYKHVYFNSNFTTFKMWTSTVLFFVGMYEGVKYLAKLRARRKLRWAMALLVVSSIHSHYYAWWGHWNYWNDDFYSQWDHQSFFTLTELVSTALVFSQMNNAHPTQTIPLLIIGTIAIFHISAAMLDQFFINIFQMVGESHQILRDIPLMSTDCVQVFIIWRELRVNAERNGIFLYGLVSKKKNYAAVLGTFSLMFIYSTCSSFVFYIIAACGPFFCYFIIVYSKQLIN